MDNERRTRLTLIALSAFVLGLALSTQAQAAENAGVPPHLREHPIMIDATQLDPPTWWYVPGVTPLIWSLDPSSTEAFRTTDLHEITLPSGAYRFGTFTFDFPFAVTPEGVLNFASHLDQCVGGRGTQTLLVRCTKTQPYAGRPDY